MPGVRNLGRFCIGMVNKERDKVVIREKLYHDTIKKGLSSIFSRYYNSKKVFDFSKQ